MPTVDTLYFFFKWMEIRYLYLQSSARKHVLNIYFWSLCPFCFHVICLTQLWVQHNLIKLALKAQNSLLN